MDIDLKCFFEHQSPRIKKDLSEYVCTLAGKIVAKIIMFSELLFPKEKITLKHVKMIVLSMCTDPITMYNKNGLCVQNVKMKPISKVLCRSIDDSIQALQENKYGNVDKKIFKCCSKILRDQIKTNNDAVVAIATIVSQICGILIQSTVAQCDDSIKTLCLEDLLKHGTNHTSTNGEMIPYSSLIRFLHCVQHFEAKPKLLDHKKEQQRKSMLEAKPKVTFDKQKYQTNIVDDISFQE
jgi:hypothetical protein